jgi:hypothetical protein
VRALAIAFGSLVVVVVALLLAVWLWIDPDELREPLAAQLSAAIDRPVTIGELDLAVLPIPALRARDVRLGRERRGVPALAEIEEVRLRLRLLPLLVGRIALGAVEIRSPRIALPTDAAGRLELPELPSGTAGAPEPSAAAEGAPLIAIDRIRVRDGRVEAGALLLEGIDVDGRLDADGTAAVDFAFDLGRGGPGVRSGHADLEGLLGDSPRARVSGEIEGSIAGLAALALLRDRMSGELSGSFELELRDAAIQTGRLDLRGTDLVIETDAVELDGEVALVAEIGDVWALDLTDAALVAGGAVKPRGTQLELRGTLPSLEMDALRDLAVLLPSNRLDLEVVLAGPATSISIAPGVLELAPLSDLLPAPAEGTLRHQGIQLSGLPRSVRGKLVLDAVRMQLERGPLELSGTLEGLGSRIYTPALALGIADQSVEVAATYELVSQRLALVVETSDQDLEALVGWLTGATDYSGRLTGKTQLVLSLGGSGPVQLRSGTGHLEVRPGAIRGFSILREALGGLAEVPLLLARLKGRDLSRYEQEEFESLTVDFSVERNALRLEDLVVVYQGGTATLRGTVGLDDGALDLSGAIRFERELADEIGGGSRQAIVLPIAGVGGTLDRPRLQLDSRDVFEAAALWAAEGGVRETLDSVLGPGGGEAVEGLLDQLLRRGGARQKQEP